MKRWKVILNKRRVYYFNNISDAYGFAKFYGCPTPYQV